MSETVKVRLLEREYQLRSQGDSDLVQEAALLVEKKLSELSTTVAVDTRDRYILVMLTLAGEYLQEKRKNQMLEGELQEWQAGNRSSELLSDKIQAELIDRIDNALK